MPGSCRSRCASGRAGNSGSPSRTCQDRVDRDSQNGDRRYRQRQSGDNPGDHFAPDFGSASIARRFSATSSSLSQPMTSSVIGVS